MKMKWQMGLMATLALLAPTLAGAQRFDTGNVEVEVVNDRGRSYPQYPLDGRGSRVFKAYVEAVRGQNYSIQIRNRTTAAGSGRAGRGRAVGEGLGGAQRGNRHAKNPIKRGEAAPTPPA